MNSVLKSALLTAIAVPFLFAAPAKKAQNSTPAAAPSASASKKAVKKHHVKKAVKPAAQSDANSTSAPAK